MLFIHIKLKSTLISNIINLIIKVEFYHYLYINIHLVFQNYFISLKNY
jgi:hypothetical protein